MLVIELQRHGQLVLGIGLKVHLQNEVVDIQVVDAARRAVVLQYLSADSRVIIAV